MVKIGKHHILLVIASLCSLQAAPRVSLTLKDLNGNDVDRVQVGEQLTLRVRVEDWNGQTIVIPGLDRVEHDLRGSNKILFTMNGKESKNVEYEYMIKPDKLGQFVIGPVVFDGATSNTITMQVRHHVRRRQSAHQEFILECEPSKAIAVVGEKIRIMMKLKTTQNVQEFRIMLPELDKETFIIGNTKQGKDYDEPVDDRTYHVYPYSCDMIVTKSGNWLIPEISCLARVPMNSRLMGKMFMNMGFGVQDKTFYASNFTLNVIDLPAYDGAVHGVGDFTEYACSIDKTRAAQHEGIILCLYLKGDGAFEMVKSPQLALPEALTYYYSKVEDSHDGDEHVRKFEYIVQGLTTGSWTIPSQEITFYSPQSHTYRTLRTQPRTLEITHGAPAPSGPSVAPVDEQHEIAWCMLNQEDSWLPRSEPALPAYLFWLLALAPLFGVVSWLLYIYYAAYQERHSRYYDHKYAFARARRSLAILQKNHNVAGLHELYAQLCKDRIGLSDARMHNEYLYTYLIKQGMPKDVADQWQRFSGIIAQVAYDKDAREMTEKDLFDRATIWIDQLEEYL